VPQGRSGRAENLVPTRIRSRTVQPVVSQYTDWATRPTTEISTRNISWGIKAAGAQKWQPYHLHVSTILKCGSLNLLEQSGPVKIRTGIALPYVFWSAHNKPHLFARLLSLACWILNLKAQWSFQTSGNIQRQRVTSQHLVKTSKTARNA